MTLVRVERPFDRGDARQNRQATRCGAMFATTAAPSGDECRRHDEQGGVGP